jgi:NADPH:quinone reductase
VGAASSAEKLALARDHGADEGVQYPAGPLDKIQARALTDRFKAACGPDGTQVIYGAVGGDYTEAALRAIGWQGRHLVVGFPAAIPNLPLNLPLLKSCQIIDRGARCREHSHRQNTGKSVDSFAASV